MNRNTESMLVEDSPAQAQSLEDILVQNHDGVSVAHSGEEALAWLAGQVVLLACDALAGLDSAIKDQPDLVLLDIGLPAGSGLVVAERIQDLVPKLTPIIFLTASRQPGLRDKAMALGAAGFLGKPFEADELMAAIQNALNPPGDPSSKL